MISLQKCTDLIPPIILISCSLMMVLFLFYLDEGNFNFQWIQQPGNWLLFGLYFIFTLLGQLIFVNIFCTRRSSWLMKISVMSLGGLIGCSFLIYLFS